MKQTKVEVCKKHGITRDVLNSAQNAGVNIWNDDDLKKHLGGRRHRIAKDAKIKPETKQDQALLANETTEQSIEQIERLLIGSMDIDNIKIYHEKLKALKVGLQVRMQTRELLPAGEVKEDMIRIASAARSELLKFSNDFSPRLEGLTAAKIQSIIHEEMTRILTNLSNAQHKLYQ
jgi:hypothetical protein